MVGQKILNFIILINVLYIFWSVFPGNQTEISVFLVCILLCDGGVGLLVLVRLVAARRRPNI
jgi:hypothetical protein